MDGCLNFVLYDGRGAVGEETVWTLSASDSFDHFYLSRGREEYHTLFLGLIDDHWQESDQFGYDTVAHVAALVHQKEG